MKFKKKYTPEQAREQEEITRVQIQNFIEEWFYWKIREDTLILALSRKTKEQCIKDAEFKIKYLCEKLQYIRKFIYVNNK